MMSKNDGSKIVSVALPIRDKSGVGTSDGTERSGKENEDAIFLRLPRVRALTGLSESSLYELVRARRFPTPVQIGPRTVAWVSDEVRQWAAERISASRHPLEGFSPRSSSRSQMGARWSPSKRSA